MELLHLITSFMLVKNYLKTNGKLIYSENQKGKALERYTLGEYTIEIKMGYNTGIKGDYVVSIQRNGRTLLHVGYFSLHHPKEIVVSSELEKLVDTLFKGCPFTKRRENREIRYELPDFVVP